jgi:hypothetical protein
VQLSASALSVCRFHTSIEYKLDRDGAMNCNK